MLCDAVLDRRRQTTAALVARMGGRVTARQLARRLWKYRRIAAATAMLETMVQRGMGRWEPQPTGPKGGRPTRLFVLASTEPATNPMV